MISSTGFSGSVGVVAQSYCSRLHTLQNKDERGHFHEVEVDKVLANVIVVKTSENSVLELASFVIDEIITDMLS